MAESCYCGRQGETSATEPISSVYAHKYYVILFIFVFIFFFRLVKAHEVDELLGGQEEKYRAAGSTPSQPRPAVENKVAKVNTQPGWMGQQVFF